MVRGIRMGNLKELNKHNNHWWSFLLSLLLLFLTISFLQFETRKTFRHQIILSEKQVLETELKRIAESVEFNLLNKDLALICLLYTSDAADE